MAAAWFGPGVTIPEVFGYLGAGFLLAAWSAFVARLAGDGRENMIGAGSIAAAVVLVALGDVARDRRCASVEGGRRRRPSQPSPSRPVASSRSSRWATSTVSSPPTLATGVGTALAAGLRVVHPGLLTQFGLLSALTSFAAALLAWLELLVRPDRLTFSESGLVIPAAGPDPRLLALAAAIVAGDGRCDRADRPA